MTEHINPVPNEALPTPGEFDGLSLYELSQKALDPNAPAAGEEFFGRLDMHSAAAAEFFGKAEVPEGFMTAELDDQTSVFRMDGQRVPTLSDVFFDGMGLPKPPEGFSALAIVIEESDEVTSVRLVSETGDNMVLTSPDISTTNPDFEPEWTQVGNSAIPGNKLNVVDQNGFKKIVIEPKIGVDDDALPSAAIIRGELTTKEMQATNPEGHKEKAKKGFRRTALLLGASILSLAGSIGVGDSDDFSYEPGVEYTELANIDADAIVRFQEAYEAKVSGDDAALEQMIAASEFGKEHVEAKYFTEVEDASSIAEIDKILSEVMETFDVSGSVLTEDYDHYEAVNSSDIDAAKEATLGVFDFASKFGPLLDNNEHLRIQIVDSSGDSDDVIGNEHGSAGSYIAKTNLITLNLGNISGSSTVTRLRAEQVVGHEKAHDDSLRKLGPTTSTSNTRSINPEGAGYREDFNPSRLLKIGVEVSANHGLDNVKEDTAELFEALQKGLASPDGEIDTVLEHKLAALLSDMEEETPGISALMLSMQVDAAQTSKIEKADSALIEAVKGARNNAKTAATLFFVAGLASAAAATNSARKASMQVNFDGK